MRDEAQLANEILDSWHMHAAFEMTNGHAKPNAPVWL